MNYLKIIYFTILFGLNVNSYCETLPQEHFLLKEPIIIVIHKIKQTSLSFTIKIYNVPYTYYTYSYDCKDGKQLTEDSLFIQIKSEYNSSNVMTLWTNAYNRHKANFYVKNIEAHNDFETSITRIIPLSGNKYFGAPMSGEIKLNRPENLQKFNHTLKIIEAFIQKHLRQMNFKFK